MVGQDGAVEVGSLVTVQDGALRERWRIVGPEDSDPFEGRLNQECPLAKALLGHRVGERVQVAGSRRPWDVEILTVE
jgi:transcription elongation factor GreA